MGFEQTTAPTTEPVTIEMVKRHCRFVNKLDKDLLLQKAVAAREWCEAYLSRQLCTAQFKWTVDRFINQYLYQTSLWTQQIWPWYFQSQALIGNRLPNTWYCLFPPISPVVTIDSIRYIDLNGAWQTLDPRQYLFSADERQARLTPAYGGYWPATQMRVDAVEIILTAGSRPEKVSARHKEAICQLAAYWYDQRESVTFDQPAECPLHTLSLLGAPNSGRYMTP